MINWPEMLRNAEDWAAGFWAGAATASVVGIVAVAAALIASLGYTMLRTDGYMQRDSLVTVGASVAAATGCWFLTRRFARTA